jgi:hypothetical protein
VETGAIQHCVARVGVQIEPPHSVFENCVFLRFCGRKRFWLDPIRQDEIVKDRGKQYGFGLEPPVSGGFQKRPLADTARWQERC